MCNIFKEGGGGGGGGGFPGSGRGGGGAGGGGGGGGGALPSNGLKGMCRGMESRIFTLD